MDHDDGTRQYTAEEMTRAHERGVAVGFLTALGLVVAVLLFALPLLLAEVRP
jgi:hypothetical protein